MSRRIFIPEAGGVRLDLFLVELLGRYTRAYVKDMILGGRVRVDGISAKPSRLLKGGERVEVDEAGPAAGPSGALRDWIIHEDPELLVLDKPAGLLMHPLGTSWLKAPEATLSGEPTLAGVLFRERPDSAGQLPRCGIVHRLDRQTSGVLLVAKTLRAQENLVAAFKDRRVRKVYNAIVRGSPQHGEFRIDAPIGRKPGHRRVMVTPFGRPAQTGMKVLESRAGAALLEVMPLTGRTHQIRAHLALLGYPVMGDVEHDDAAALPRPPRMMLHARRIELKHPATGKPVSFETRLPSDFQDFWRRIDAA